MGSLIVYNTPEFDLLIIHKEVKTLDTAKFCEVFDMTSRRAEAKVQGTQSQEENIRQLSPQPF